MITQNIKLGPQETKLLFSLEEKGISVFTTKDAKKILDSGSASAWLVISGLKKKVRIIGGCCGTNPEHIAVLRKVIDEKSHSI
jgi:S-methylmethionine-dependent homocysteine/selenocysteine methylase